MKKITVMILLGVLLCACGKASVAVKEGIVIEYGSEIKAEQLTKEKVTLKEVKDYDAKKIGEQKVIAVFVNEKEKEIEEEITLEVKDTKKPEIKLKKDKVEITESDQFDPVSNIESVKDPVDGDIKKSEDKKLTKNGYLINSDVDNKKAGSYIVTITAYDVNGNKAESSYQVTVKEKPQEQAPAATQPSNQTSGYSGGYSNNTGSTSNGGASASTGNANANNNVNTPSTSGSTSSSQNNNQPHVHSFPYPTGYDDVYIYEDQYFDTLDESDAFANNFWGPNGDWSGKGWGGTECECGKTRLYFHHITYFEN